MLRVIFAKTTSISIMVALLAVPLMAGAMFFAPAALEQEEADAAPIEGAVNDVQIRAAVDRSYCLTAIGVNPNQTNPNQGPRNTDQAMTMRPCADDESQQYYWLQRFNYEPNGHRIFLVWGRDRNASNPRGSSNLCIDNFGGDNRAWGIQLTTTCGVDANVNEWNYARQGSSNLAPGSFRNPRGVCWNIATHTTGGTLRSGTEVQKGQCFGTGDNRHDNQSFSMGTSDMQVTTGASNAGPRNQSSPANAQTVRPGATVNGTFTVVNAGPNASYYNVFNAFTTVTSGGGPRSTLSSSVSTTSMATNAYRTTVSQSNPVLTSSPAQNTMPGLAIPSGPAIQLLSRGGEGEGAVWRSSTNSGGQPTSGNVTVSMTIPEDAAVGSIHQLCGQNDARITYDNAASNNERCLYYQVEGIPSDLGISDLLPARM